MKIDQPSENNVASWLDERMRRSEGVVLTLDLVQQENGASNQDI